MRATSSVWVVMRVMMVVRLAPRARRRPKFAAADGDRPVQVERHQHQTDGEDEGDQLASVFAEFALHGGADPGQGGGGFDSDRGGVGRIQHQ